MWIKNNIFAVTEKTQRRAIAISLVSCHVRNSIYLTARFQYLTLSEMCPNWSFFLVLFFYVYLQIQSDYGEMRTSKKLRNRTLYSMWVAAAVCKKSFFSFNFTSLKRRGKYERSSCHVCVCIITKTHHVKSVRIRRFSGPYLVQMQENMDQKNSEYRHFSRSDEQAFNGWQTISFNVFLGKFLNFKSNYAIWAIYVLFFWVSVS